MTYTGHPPMFSCPQQGTPSFSLCSPPCHLGCRTSGVVCCRLVSLSAPATKAVPTTRITLGLMGLGLLAVLALIAQGLGLCPRLDGRPLPSGHPPVPYHWASQASWPVEPADFVAALKEVDMDAVAGIAVQARYLLDMGEKSACHLVGGDLQLFRFIIQSAYR